jgi:hypothetical protein
LMRLLVCRQEILNDAEIGVFFKCHGPGLRNIISKPSGWREIEIFEPLPGIVEDRIDDEINFSGVPADDGAYLRRLSVGIH